MIYRIDGTQIYLAGSIHALPQAHRLLPLQLSEIHGRARLVFFERRMDLMPSIPAVARLPDRLTLETLVPQPCYQAVEAFFQRSGGTLPYLSLKPWFLAIVCAVMVSESVGLSHQIGVDAQLWQATPAPHRRTLETDEGFALLDAVPLSEQISFLNLGVTDTTLLAQRSLVLAQCWVESNHAGFEAELKRFCSEFPNIAHGLLDLRNAAWTPQIIDLVTAPQDTTLVLVGALHLVGAKGIPALLREAGLTLAQLD